MSICFSVIRVGPGKAPEAAATPDIDPIFIHPSSLRGGCPLGLVGKSSLLEGNTLSYKLLM